jgi:hypothetical protein
MVFGNKNGACTEDLPGGRHDRTTEIPPAWRYNRVTLTAHNCLRLYSFRLPGHKPQFFSHWKVFKTFRCIFTKHLVKYFSKNFYIYYILLSENMVWTQQGQEKLLMNKKELKSYTSHRSMKLQKRLSTLFSLNKDFLYVCCFRYFNNYFWTFINFCVCSDLYAYADRTRQELRALNIHVRNLCVHWAYAKDT